MAGYTLKTIHGLSGAIATVGTYDSDNYLIRLAVSGSDGILTLTPNEAEDAVAILGKAIQIAREANQKELA